MSEEQQESLAGTACPPNSNSNSKALGASTLACESCRRRKAKCDREKPSCSICSKAGQKCNYPAGRLKSGPKLGSTQQGRRRARRNTLRKDSDGTNFENEDDEDADEEPDPYSKRQRQFNRVSEKNIEADKNSFRGKTNSFSQQERPFGQGRPPLSPDYTEASDSQSSHPLDTGSMPLSYILHPSHETNITTSDPNDLEDPSNTREKPAETSNILMEVCISLNITMETFRFLTNSYFKNMTFSSMFHQPTFDKKIRNVKSSTSLKALMSSMFCFSSRFEHATWAHQGRGHGSKCPAGIPLPTTLQKLALGFIEDALNDCGDEAPSLALLQAMILVTFYQVCQGVRGRAWRYLGKLIRVAYEKNLHLIDCGPKDEKIPKSKSEILRWCFDEERRRAWWAIWEIDVFASTIRRCPTGIDWLQNRTFLPVHDTYWFNYRYHPSCYLEVKPTNRWKALQETGNEASQAWFVVVNSLMKDAQVLSNPGSVSSHTNIPPKTTEERPPNPRHASYIINHESLTIIDHALRCYTIALPESLQWHGEYLDFPSEDSTTGQDMRQIHSARYEIYLMTQLTKFMVYNQYAFGKEGAPVSYGDNHDETRNPNWAKGSKGQLPDMQGLGRYLEAAENILTITNSCSDNHISCVKPFLASTIWLATAAQLVYKKFAPADYNQELIDSKFDVLYMQCKRYTKFWGTPTALLQNLKSLRNHLAIPLDEAAVDSHQPETFHGFNNNTRSDGSVESGMQKKDASWYGSRQSSPSVSVQSTTDPTNQISIRTSSHINPEANLIMETLSYNPESRELHPRNGTMPLGNSDQTDNIVGQATGMTGLDFDIGMVGQLDASGFADLDSFWDGMELDFETIVPDPPFSLGELLFDSYAK